MERVETEDRVGCWFIHNFVEFGQEQQVEVVKGQLDKEILYRKDTDFEVFSQTLENENSDVWIKSCGWYVCLSLPPSHHQHTHTQTSICVCCNTDNN